MWDTRATRLCDTLTWFPTKVPMPLASSHDLILGGIQDILHALQHPTAGSPFPPVTDSQHHALTELSRILTNSAEPDPPLRRVSIPTTPKKAVSFAPLPSPPTGDTFVNSTGAPGKKRRRLRRQSLASSAARTAKTVHPKKLLVSPARLVAQHSHGTRSKHLQHIAACAHALILDDARARQSPFAQDPNHMHFAYLGHAINPDTGKIAEYRELSQSSDSAIWRKSNAEEIGRLAQGYGDIKGTNTIFFIHPSAMPKGCKAAYLRAVSASYRPGKANPYRVRWTVGGDQIDYYPFDVSTKNADLTAAKLLFNSVLSTPNAKFLTADLKDLYLGTPMSRYEYMRIPVWMLPEDIIEQYNLTPLIVNGFVYVEIRRGMYGLPQAGRLANDRLVEFLAPHGCKPCALTPGLWRHDTRAIVFSLVVDDFGIRYTNRADADHLLDTLKLAYEVSLDWTGTRYCGLTLKWDYSARTCDVPMPGYIERALCPAPLKKEHSPHPWQRPTYGAKTQYAPSPDESPSVDAADKTRILEVLGTLLFYARAVDSTLLTAIGELATEQSQATKTTMHKLSQLLNYCASYPDATVRFHASDMLLAVESDASYLSVAKGRSRAAGYFFLTNKLPTTSGQYQPNGAAIHILCRIMREVLSSAAEAELGALFHNGKEACPLRITLAEMGHPQPATPIATDNNTASGIVNDTVKQKRSKAIDTHFYWIRDRVCQGQSKIFWSKGKTNRADYYSKHHPGSHHQAIRPVYLYSPSNPFKNYFDCLADDAPAAASHAKSLTTVRMILVRVCC